MIKVFEMLKNMKFVPMSAGHEGEEQSRMIDFTHYDEDGFYFLTCKSKPFYKKLIKNNRIAVTCLTKEYTQIRVVGEAKEVRFQKLEEFIKKNPRYKRLFSNGKEEGKYVLFCVSKRKGELFDISGKEVQEKEIDLDSVIKK